MSTWSGGFVDKRCKMYRLWTSLLLSLAGSEAYAQAPSAEPARPRSGSPTSPLPMPKSTDSPSTFGSPRSPSSPSVPGAPSASGSPGHVTRPDQAGPPATLELEVPPATPPRTSRPVDLIELKRKLAELKTARESLHAESQSTDKDSARSSPDDGNDIAKLRLKLMQQLARLSAGGKHSPPQELTPVKPTPPEAAGPARASVKFEKSTDALSLAHNLYKVGDYENALKAFEQMDLRGMKTEEWAPIKYMMASCYRHLNKLDQAANLYREVANAKADELVAECARWQIASIRSRQELDTQLQNIRRRRASLEKKQ